MKFARIINKGQCLSTINGSNKFNWSKEHIKALAGKSEWIKGDFYPANGMVGIVVDQFHNPLWDHEIIVLEIDRKWFVPMHENSIEYISEIEYEQAFLFEHIPAKNVNKDELMKDVEIQDMLNNFFAEQFNPFGYDENEKIAIYYILHSLMQADGLIQFTELLYSQQIQQTLKISELQKEKAILIHPLIAISTIHNMNDEKKNIFKIMMQEMIKADGEIHSEEHDLFLTVCSACQL